MTVSVCSGPNEDDTLLAAMEAGIKDKVRRIQKSGLDTSILSAVAEGDEELATVYSKLLFYPATGKRDCRARTLLKPSPKANVNNENQLS